MKPIKIITNQGTIADTAEKTIFSASGPVVVCVMITRINDCIINLRLINAGGHTFRLIGPDYSLNSILPPVKNIILQPGEKLTLQADTANAVEWRVQAWLLGDDENGGSVTVYEPPSDAVLYYTMDNIIGNIINDEGSGLYTGAISGTLNQITGAKGLAGSLASGTGNYVEIPSLEGFPWEKTSIGFFFRLKAGENYTQAQLGIGTNDSSWPLSRRKFWFRSNIPGTPSENKLWFRWGYGDSGNTMEILISSLEVPASREWVHALIETNYYSGTWNDFRVYINSVDYGNCAQSGEIRSGTKINRIGALLGTGNYDGILENIDELLIYSRQLTPAERVAVAAI